MELKRAVHRLVMKVTASAILLVCLCMGVLAQDTTAVIEQPKTGRITLKKYSVLAVDTTVMHGCYTSYFNNGKVCQSGHFNYGHKDGEWITYFASGQLESKRHYSNDVPVGYWEFFSTGSTQPFKVNVDSMKFDLKPVSFTKVDYPRKAVQAGTEGTVLIAVTYTPACTISRLLLVHDIGNGCGAAALKALKANKAKIEARLKDCAATEVLIPVAFKLN